MLLAKSRGDVVEIGHGADVDPRARHRDHDIGVAEAERIDHQHALVGIDDGLAHQVFAGDAEMHRAARELGGDLAGRQIGDLDIVVAHHGAAIFALPPGFGERKPRPGEEGLGVLLQPPLGGNGDDKGSAHRLPPCAFGARPIFVNASTQIEKPTAGIGAAEPSWVIEPVIAAARHQRFGAVAFGVHLEFEAGVVVEPAAECGGETGLAHVDAAGGHEADAAFELVDRAADVEFCIGGQRPQLRHRVVGIARYREKALDDGRGVAWQRAGFECRLLEEAVGDLGHRAAADIARACDRHQIGDERQRGLAVAAGKGCKHAFIFVAAGRGLQGQLLDVVGQADLAVEILDQAAAPYRIELQRVDQRMKKCDVASADFDVGDAEGGGSFQRQRQHLGVGGGTVGPPERTRRRLAGIRSAGPSDSGTPGRDRKSRQAGRHAARQDNRARREW